MQSDFGSDSDCGPKFDFSPFRGASSNLPRKLNDVSEQGFSGSLSSKILSNF